MDLDGLVLDPDPEAVSEEAGQLYSHLQVLIESHGPGCVEGLLPVLVSLLESLAQGAFKAFKPCTSVASVPLRPKASVPRCFDTLCASRTRRFTAPSVLDPSAQGPWCFDTSTLSVQNNILHHHTRSRRCASVEFSPVHVLQAESALAGQTHPRFLELDDALEQERRALQGKVRAAETHSRDMERKAREYADQMAALEEQRANQSRELSALRHTHTKVSGHEEVEADQGYPKSISTPQAGLIKEEELIDREEERQEVKEPSPVDDIISATPELAHVDEIISATPELAHVDEIISATPELAHVDEIMTTSSPLPQGGAALRNTDSVFTELSGISTSDIDDVDMGASLHGAVQPVYPPSTTSIHDNCIIKPFKPAAFTCL
ncbi:JIP3 protein, partial [Polyodon spathula]|nr:JIP3 protein [Polyodon spathula]